MAKRHQPVDTDYLLSSKYYEDVRAEMLKASYLATSKDVDMAKQAEQTGLTRAGVRHLDYRNRGKRKRHQRHAGP